ncbi:Zinc finger SWIM domain-containing protein 7 [Mactra antiquata]
MADEMKPEGKAGNANDVIHSNGDASSELYEMVIDQLFAELKTVYAETGKVTDEVLSALNNVLQTPLLPALDLVDSKNVTLLVCPAGRKLYQVVGSSSTPYTCFESNNYCSCPAYKFSVLKKEEHSMCKHVLAVKLSNALGVTKELQVSNEEITDLLLHLE